MTNLKTQGCLDPLPVPTGSYIAAAPAGNYSAVQVKPNYYWISEGAYGALLYAAPGCDSILIDAPPTHGTNLRDKVASILGRNRKLDYMIYSHHHADHIGGAGIIVRKWPDVEIIAHRLVKTQLDISNENKIPFPTITFRSEYEIGPYELKDAETHSPGNLYIYSRAAKVLMIVDIIFPGWVPYYSWAMAQNFARFLQAHDEILAYNFDVLIGGHLTRPGNRQDVVTQKRFFSDLRVALQNGQAGVNQTAVFIELGAGTQNPWLVFDTYLERVIQLCYNEMVDKYKGILGGVDIITPAHCYTMSEFLSIG